MDFSTIRLLEGPGQLPLSFQLKHSLRHAISNGHLPANVQMPSVRELADQLGIATNTVVRAYKELQDDGLLVTYAGKGTFVADIVTHSRLSSDDLETLVNLLRPVVDTARSLGYARDQIAQVVADLSAEPTLHIGLVGLNPVVVKKWKRILEEEFADLGIRVVGQVITDMQQDYERAIDLFGSCYYIVSLVSTYAETRAFFREHDKKVVAIITEVSMTTHQALANLPHDEPIGLVCEDFYVNTLLSLIAPYVEPENVIRIFLDDAARLHHLLASMTYILHTFSMKAPLQSVSGNRNHLIEMEFVPNRSCFDQMRRMFMLAAQPA